MCNTFYNWDRGIRTPGCWNQNPVPYRLAISQYLISVAISNNDYYIRNRFILQAFFSFCLCQVIIGTFFIFLYNIRFPLHFLNMQLNGHLPSKTRSRLVSTVAVLGSKTPRQVPTVSNSFFRKLPIQLLFLFCEGSSLFV